MVGGVIQKVEAVGHYLLSARPKLSRAGFSEPKMTDSYTYIATVTGNQKSGYMWNQVFAGRSRGGKDSGMPNVKQSDVQQCANQALSAKTQMLAVGTLSTTYASINGCPSLSPTAGLRLSYGHKRQAAPCARCSE
jgi:hypothetical protein